MKLNKNTRSLVINLIAYLYIILFVYAAFSKLIEFRDFQTQLGQSPLLGAYVGLISYGVIVSEISCAILLATIKYRKFGLLIGFSLMIMFTVYIIIILNFTPYTPCSCGGVLESLGWTEHLVFNITFILLSVFAIYGIENSRKIGVTLLTLTLVSTTFVITLYHYSEKEINQNNAFQRKYIPHGLEKLGSLNLESNAYYIAGVSESTIYLGNYNAPNLIKAVRRDLKKSESIHLSLEDYDFPFKGTKIEIKPPYFFIGDGTVPIIFKGRIKDSYGKIYIYDLAYFQQFIPVSPEEVIFTAISSSSRTNILGLFEKGDSTTNFCLSEEIIKSQSDEPFDSNGILIWNKELEKLIYVYYYRNQYEVSDKSLNFLWQGKTIDTISVAQIDVAHYKKNNAVKIGKSTMVNIAASASGNNLFIVSNRLGKYESAEVLKSASIIDQYNILKNEYIQSFYFYHQYNQKLKDIKVIGDTIIGIVDDQLWTYKINNKYYQK